MDSDRWRQIEAAYHQAADLPVGERDAYLADLERSDPELAAEVRSLLRADLARVSQIVGRAAVEIGATPPDPEPPALDLRFGPFRATELLGEGGMGSVYRGERVEGDFEQTVALKVMRTSLASEEARTRFLAERRILASLTHDRIARFVDGGLADDGRTPWFAMELVEGRPLLEAVEEASLTERLRVFLEICDAVHYAHQNLVVHRDLKPSNILVGPSGSPRLLDFGVAKVLEPGETPDDLTRDGRALTPSYAAPEQLKGTAVTTGTDVYALGVLLYELLSGRHPFERQRRSGELEDAILHATPSRPSQCDAALEGPGRRRPVRSGPRARDLDNICLMAMRKEPERRYASVADLAADVRRTLADQPVHATPDSTGYRLRTFLRRHRAQAMTTALAGMVVVTLTLAYGIRLRRERNVALAESTKSARIAAFLTDLFAASDPSRSLGAETTARELLDEGVRKIATGLTEEPAVRSDLLHVLGDVHKRLGLYDRSLELFEEAATLDAALGEGRDAERARSLQRRGEVLLYQEHFDSAAAPLLEALDLQRAVLDEPSAEVAETLDLLGRLERSRKQLDEAEALHREALELRRRLFDEHSLPISESLQSLALVEHLRGRPEEAVRLTREALTIREDLLGASHPETLELRQNLATSLQRTGDLEEALRVMNDVLEGVRKAYGEDHQNFATTLGGVAYSLQQLGRIEEAVAYDRRAVEIFRRRGGGPSGVTDLVQLARHLTQLGELAEAESAAREALVWLEDSPENPDPKRSNVLVDLGTILTLEGRFDEAAEALRETLRLDLATYGEEHSYVAQDRYKLGDLARIAGRPTEALEWLNLALERQRRLRPGANALGRSLTSRGEVLLTLGRLEEGEQTLREALEVFAIETPVDHPDFAAARAALGAVLAARGRVGEAREHLGRAVADLEAKLGAKHARTKAAKARFDSLG